MTTPKTITVFQRGLAKLSKPLMWGMAISVSLVGIFAKISEDLIYNELGMFDKIVGEFIRGFTTPWLTRVEIVITNLGSAYIEISLLVIVGAFLWFRLRHTWETVFLAISLTGAWLLNTLLKELFQRERPNIMFLVHADGHSFPSGHTMVATAFYGVLGYIVWLNLRNHGKPSWYCVAVTFILISAIGMSRIYLGVHYASDVIAGYTAGGIWTIACIIGLKEIRNHTGKKL